MCTERKGGAEAHVGQVPDDMELYVARLLDCLRERGETVTTVESCTGGLVAGRITDIPGSSDVFRQGFVTYCDAAKHQLVGVRTETLERYTAVSPQTAEEMAVGGAKKAGADACLSVTGYAGPPSGPEDTSVGLVYVGCFYRGKTAVWRLQLTGDRRSIRRQAVAEALRLLGRCMGEPERVPAVDVGLLL